MEPRYRIDSQGNGAFVTIRVSDGRSVFMQGEDAVQFLEELDRTNDRYTADDLCAEFFDEN